MSVFYSSTRNNSIRVSASQAILQGLSRDGGLFVPDRIPRLETALADLPKMSYQETAYEVMRLFLSDFTREELMDCIAGAYDEKFDTPQIAPLRQAGDMWYLELFHGKTIAFKDMALSILPRLMRTAARKNQIKNEIVILTATSGDTGKAALEGFANVPGTRIIVFYPKHGVSPIQEKQMITQQGENTCVVGIEGNFDQAQSGVKEIFSNESLRRELDQRGFQFSSANSINIGRLVPQIVYYVYAYGRMIGEGQIKPGERINVTVPTGNFGNILAAFYAKQMGLPVDRLICASNENKVLFDFFSTGTYDKNRPFVLTTSPSMDILISSNLERLIYRIAGEDSVRCAALMDALSAHGSYILTEQEREKLKDFYGNFADQEETAQEIADVWKESGYLLDPHTAVASRVYRKYVRESEDTKKTVIVSTASPYKFTRSVMEALGQDTSGQDDFALADRLSELSGVKIPAAVEEIKTAPIRHHQVVPAAGMERAVLDFLAS